MQEWSAAKAVVTRGLAASATAPAWMGLFGMVNMTVTPQRLRPAAALAVRMIGACYMTRCGLDPVQPAEHSNRSSLG